MCMEMYHGDEDFIEDYEAETMQMAWDASDDDEPEGMWYVEGLGKTNNDPAWV